MSEFTDILNTALNEKKDTKTEAVGVNVGHIRREILGTPDKYPVVTIDKSGRKRYGTFTETDEDSFEFIIYVE